MNWLAISFKYAGEFPKVFGHAFVGDFIVAFPRIVLLRVQEPRSNPFHSDPRKTRKRHDTPDKYSKHDCRKTKGPLFPAGPIFNLKPSILNNSIQPPKSLRY